MSLPFGGTSDLNAAYGRSGDHDEHRDGRSADIRTRDLTVAQLNRLRNVWQRLSGLPEQEALLDETGTDQPHFHVRTRN